MASYRIKWHRRRLSAACAMQTMSCCLRETVFLLPPTPGTKTDQRHKPCPEENHRRRQRNWRHRQPGDRAYKFGLTGVDILKYHAPPTRRKGGETRWSRRQGVGGECPAVGIAQFDPETKSGKRIRSRPERPDHRRSHHIRI